MTTTVDLDYVAATPAKAWQAMAKVMVRRQQQDGERQREILFTAAAEANGHAREATSSQSIASPC